MALIELDRITPVAERLARTWEEGKYQQGDHSSTIKGRERDVITEILSNPDENCVLLIMAKVAVELEEGYNYGAGREFIRKVAMLINQTE